MGLIGLFIFVVVWITRGVCLVLCFDVFGGSLFEVSFSHFFWLFSWVCCVLLSWSCICLMVGCAVLVLWVVSRGNCFQFLCFLVIVLVNVGLV